MPGRPWLYASTCGACEARCGLLVTTRDGRPVKLEGNPDHPLSSGATCAVGQASLLGLYDSLRLAYPTRRGQRSTWADVDNEIAGALGRIRRDGGAVRILTPTLASPTTAAVIADFARLVQERAACQLRSDLGFGRARGARADARLPAPASLPFRSSGRHRQLRRRFSRHVDLAGRVHPRLHEPSPRRRAGRPCSRLVPRPDRVAAVA